MSTYLVTWTERVVMGVNIEAKSKEEAINKWYQNDYDSILADPIDSDGIVDGTLEAELV